MKRKVFFSFQYNNDCGRIGQVRNSSITKQNNKSLIDKVDWETLKRTGDQSIKNWIEKQLYGTSITIVLIGNKTISSKWVKYEIKKSFERGNALIGIYIHNLKDFRTGSIQTKGKNPFENFNYKGKKLSVYIDTYNWKLNDGYKNIEKWIEIAIKNKKW